MTLNSAPEHFRIEIDADNIAWLYFDKAGSGTNTFDLEALEQLDGLLREIASQCPRGLVILSAKKNGFIAGADIKSLIASVSSEAEAMTVLDKGQSVFNRLAAFSIPTVALVHGFCLGGGLELALACRYRVTRDDPGTRLGLPEILLGVHPGWGGSARLVPLIGAVKAMDLILSGRTVEGRVARRMGFVDNVVPERHLHNAARQLVLEPPPARRPGLLDRATNWAPVRPLLAIMMRKQVAKRASRTHYPAPYAMIEVWKKYAGNTARMLTEEARSFARLVTTDTSKNLVRVFFLQERLKSLGKDHGYAAKHVHVIGAGTMGGDIAAWCALRGFSVTLQDQGPERIAPAMKRAHALFKKKLKLPRRVTAAMDRLVPDPGACGVARADIVIEAIFEDAEVKRGLYREIEPKMKADAVLASNTSSIPLEELSDALEQPGRLVGLHFFNPVAKMKLVEVVRGRLSADAAIQRATAFTRQIDRLPLPVSSTPGFLVNRILMPYLMEAVVMEAEGVPVEQIDHAATDFGMPMGPVELADTVGLDICLHVAEILSGHFGGTVPERLKSLVDAGHLGRKTGRGFYTWKNGRPARKRGANSKARLGYISDRLMLRLLNETVCCLRENVVEDGELMDAGMIFGTGFAPFRGGPAHYIETIGREVLLAKLEELKNNEGPRFTADDGWVTTGGEN